MSGPSPAPARLRLLTGPAGSGKTQAALDRIRAAAAAAGPGRPAGSGRDALLILPTYAQVMHVKRRALSRWDVRGILDEPFSTFTAAGERFLPGFRVRALPSPEERDRLMEEALRACDVAGFRAVAATPGFRARLLRLVKELKQTGLGGGEARERLARARAQVAAPAHERLEGFLRVFECYDDLLERAGLEDHEDTLRRLAASLRTASPAQVPRLLVVDGFDDFTRVEERILDALAGAVAAAGGEVVVTLPWDEARPLLFAASRGARQRLLGRGFEERRLAGFPRAAHTPLAHIAATLFAAGAEQVEGGDHVQTLVSGGAEDEAETVARTARAVVEREGVEGVRGWRDVGVIVRRLDDHAPRLESALERQGVPVRVAGHGEPLAAEPLVRAVRGPLGVLAGEVEAGRFDARGILEWLRWRALRGGDDVPVAPVDEWDIRLRRYGLPADFGAMRRKAPPSLRPYLDALHETAASLAALRGAGALYDGLAAALEALAPQPALAGFDDEGRPLDPEWDRRVARDEAARARLAGILAAMRVAAERTGLGGAATPRDAVRELLDAAEQTTLRLADRRLDAVTIMDAEEARFWELPVVIVAGLEEGGFPLRPREDILLRDADREALCAKDDALSLPLAREREVRERRLFYGALTRARARLYLSRCAYDERGDPKQRSFFLRELESVVRPTTAAVARTPGRLARSARECFTEQDWRLFAAARLGPWSARRRDLPERERALAAALQSLAGSTAPARAARNRRRSADALWRSAAEQAEVLAHFQASSTEVSVSRLNHALLCPHRFFLAYVARIREDDLTLDGPVFDARDRGTALHHAFELAVRHPERASAEVARAGVERVAARGLDARLLQGELVRAVDLLREREAATAGPLAPWPEGLELDFRGERAVELGPGDCRFRLGGQIDRVDRAGRDASLVDYKRSAGSVEGAFARGRDGQDLQLPLYARALEVLADITVVGFEWVAGLTRTRRILHDADAAHLFAVRREGKAVQAVEHGAFRSRLESAETRATELVRAIRAGARERRPHDPKTCDKCPWTAVCRPDRAWLELQRARREAEEDDA